MLRKIVFFLVLSTAKIVVAQTEVYELPVYYGLFFNDPQVNTLIHNQSSDIQLNLAHRRNSNNFGGINTSLFSGKFKKKSKKEDTHHSFGVQIVSDKEGFLIRRNRAAITYGYHFEMNEKYNLAAGFSSGFYNFSIVSNEVTGGYSSYTFDGSFSLALYNVRTKIGFNVNQFTNPTIRPVEQDVILARHINIFLSQQFNLGDEVKFIPSLISRYSKKNTSVFSGLGASLSAKFLFKNKFMAGASIEKSNGLYFYGGMEKIKTWNSSFIDFGLSYFVPNGANQRSNVQLFEVYLSLNIIKKSNQ